ncbi:hypothetical protein D3C74_355960 [compost metagenome]
MGLAKFRPELVFTKVSILTTAGPTASTTFEASVVPVSSDVVVVEGLASALPLAVFAAVFDTDAVVTGSPVNQLPRSAMNMEPERTIIPARKETSTAFTGFFGLWLYCQPLPPSVPFPPLPPRPPLPSNPVVRSEVLYGTGLTGCGGFTSTRSGSRRL